MVCSRCARKAGVKDFRKTLKRALKAQGAKGCRVVESTCLDLCPKRRIVLATAADLASGRLRVISPDDAETAATAIIRDRHDVPRPASRKRGAGIDTAERQA